VGQDEPALRLMGANPVRIKQWAFGIATGVTALRRRHADRGRPVEPSLDPSTSAAPSPGRARRLGA